MRRSMHRSHLRPVPQVAATPGSLPTSGTAPVRLTAAGSASLRQLASRYKAHPTAKRDYNVLRPGYMEPLSAGSILLLVQSFAAPHSPRTPAQYAARAPVRRL